MGLASIGSDTGGSIRIPASVCGIVGLKPGAGEVPTAGVVPLSSTLDHVGPMTRTVQDAAWLWAILAGQDRHPGETPGPSAVRLGRLNGYFSLVSAEVRDAFEQGLDALRAAGMTTTDVTLDRTEDIMPAYVSIALAEAATWHARYLDTRGSEYLPATRARLETGRSILAIDYLRAQQARGALLSAVDDALAACDALVLPTLPVVAPALGASEVALEGGHTGAARLSLRAAMLRHTQLFNLTGHPAISLPLRTPGLPVGLQLVGRHHGTARLLAVAAAVEQTLGSPFRPARPETS
jgi:aspartyl-tRNA(Asn)/glutamyl-tRNA(Gln) amidotransferase subunit A